MPAEFLHGGVPAAKRQEIIDRFQSEGTVEDRIAELLARKRGLTEAVLAGGETALTELDGGELRALVSLSQGRRMPGECGGMGAGRGTTVRSGCPVFEFPCKRRGWAGSGYAHGRGPRGGGRRSAR